MTKQEIKNQFIQFIEDGIEEGMIGLDYAEEVFEYDDDVAFHYFEMFNRCQEFVSEEKVEELFDEIFG